MIRDLLDSAIALVREGDYRIREGPGHCEVEEWLLELLLPGERSASFEDDAPRPSGAACREKLREQLKAGELEDGRSRFRWSSVRASACWVRWGWEMDVEFQSMLEKMMPVRGEIAPTLRARGAKVLLVQVSESWWIATRFSSRRSILCRAERHRFSRRARQDLRDRIQTRPGRFRQVARPPRSASDRRRLDRHHQVRPGEDRPHFVVLPPRIEAQRKPLMPEFTGPISHPRGIVRPDQGRFCPHPARAEEFPDPPAGGTSGDRGRVNRIHGRCDRFDGPIGVRPEPPARRWRT